MDTIGDRMGALARAQIAKIERDIADDREARIERYRDEQRQLVEDANFLGMKARLLAIHHTKQEAQDAYDLHQAESMAWRPCGRWSYDGAQGAYRKEWRRQGGAKGRKPAAQMSLAF